MVLLQHKDNNVNTRITNRKALFFFFFPGEGELTVPSPPHRRSRAIEM